MPEAVVTAAGPPRAHLGRRLAALCYDTIAAFAVLYFALLPLPALTDQPITAAHPWYLAVQFYMVAVLFLFFAWCWRKGKTLGMLSWGLEITSRDRGAVSWSEAARRFALAVPSLGLFGLGLFWQLFDKEGLALHDRLSGTMLIQATRGAAKK